MENMFKIDKDKLKNLIEKTGKKGSEISAMLGHSRNYISTVCYSGHISNYKLQPLCSLLNCEPKDFAYEEPKKNAPAVAKQYGDGEITGYSAEVKVFPDRVLLKFYFGGAEIGHGYSRIKGNDELALFQAFSYAAHIVYKNKEQEVLASEDL